MAACKTIKTNNSKTLIVYCTGLLHGLAMVSFPASGTALKDIKGFSDAQFGFIFIPQIIAAIIGSVAAGGLARKLGLKMLLAASLFAAALSQASFSIAIEVLAAMPAYYLTLASTAIFGFAFGIGAAPLNAYPTLLFPQKSESTLVAMHTLLGAGLPAGPLLVGFFDKAGILAGLSPGSDCIGCPFAGVLNRRQISDRIR